MTEIAPDANALWKSEGDQFPRNSRGWHCWWIRPVVLTALATVLLPFARGESAAIMNTATLKPTAAAPGEIVTIVAVGVSPAPISLLQIADRFHRESTLQKTQVLFSGAPAMVLDASDERVTVVVPQSVRGFTTVNIQVLSPGGYSSINNVPVADSAPGLFTIDNSGSGIAVATNANGTANGISNPAAAGSTITILATGTGIVHDRHLQSGSAPSEKPMTVTIGGVLCSVIHVRGADELPGADLITVLVPDSFRLTGELPIVVATPTATTPAGPMVCLGDRLSGQQSFPGSPETDAAASMAAEQSHPQKTAASGQTTLQSTSGGAAAASGWTDNGTVLSTAESVAIGTPLPNADGKTKVVNSQEGFYENGVKITGGTAQVGVMAFRAVGDGVANDYAAFVAARDALPAKGGTVKIPAGSYYLGTAFAMRDSVSLDCDPGAYLLFKATDGIVWSSIAHHAHLSNCNVYALSASSGKALYFNGVGVSNVQVTNVNIGSTMGGNVWAYGEYFLGAELVTFVGGQVATCTVPIHLESSTLITWSGGWVQVSGPTGVETVNGAFGSSTNKFVGVHITGSASTALLHITGALDSVQSVASFWQQNNATAPVVLVDGGGAFQGIFDVYYTAATVAVNLSSSRWSSILNGSGGTIRLGAASHNNYVQGYSCRTTPCVTDNGTDIPSTNLVAWTDNSGDYAWNQGLIWPGLKLPGGSSPAELPNGATVGAGQILGIGSQSYGWYLGGGGLNLRANNHDNLVIDSNGNFYFQNNASIDFATNLMKNTSIKARTGCAPIYITAAGVFVKGADTSCP